MIRKIRRHVKHRQRTRVRSSKQITNTHSTALHTAYSNACTTVLYMCTEYMQKYGVYKYLYLRSCNTDAHTLLVSSPQIPVAVGMTAERNIGMSNRQAARPCCRGCCCCCCCVLCCVPIFHSHSLSGPPPSSLHLSVNGIKLLARRGKGMMTTTAACEIIYTYIRYNRNFVFSNP